MTPDARRRLIEQLLEARCERRQIAVPDERLGSADEVYAIQDGVLAGIGPIGGWKVGAASPSAEPACAPLPVTLVAPGPITVPAGSFAHLGIEAEIAFRIGADLPAREEPYTREETIAAVAAAVPAIEIVDSRWKGWPRVDRMWQLADHQSNGMLVYGQGRTDWHDVDFAIQPVRLTVDGRIAAETIGGNAAGDLLRLATWLANHVAARSGGLKAGDIVTTGSCTGMSFAHPGASVRASFPGLGDVEVTFAD